MHTVENEDAQTVWWGRKVQAHMGATVNCVLWPGGLLPPCQHVGSTYYKVSAAEVFELCFYLTENDQNSWAKGRVHSERQTVCMDENGSSQYHAINPFSVQQSGTVEVNLEQHLDIKPSSWADYSVSFIYIYKVYNT